MVLLRFYTIGALALFSFVSAVCAQTPVPAKKPESEAKTKISTNDGEFSIIEFTADLLGVDKDDDNKEKSETPTPETKTAVMGPPAPAKKPKVEKPKPVHAPEIARLLENYDPEKYDGKALPKSEAATYAKIFKAQEKAEFKDADAQLQKLKDARLMGHVLLQRYLHEKSPRTSFAELHDWLTHFADHPGANRVYKLANSRRPDSFSGVIPQPKKLYGVARRAEPTMRVSKRYNSSRTRSDDEVREINTLNRDVFSKIRKGEVTNALETLNANREKLDAVEYDVLAGEIAAAYLYEGEPGKALTLAHDAVKRSGLHVPKAGWVAGLVSWKNKKYSRAAKYFEIPARSTYASGWTATAGAYWAARSHMRTGNVKAVSMWLRRALGMPRTFYGLIATRALGKDFDFNWKIPTFTKDNLDILQSIPMANRAIALVMSGQKDLAQAELARIRPENNEQHEALLAYAGYANMPGLAMRLAGALTADEDENAYYDAALYPSAPWQPKDGYKIDPALVNAIMRQESKFDPMAESRSGAKGLMQLMPATAKAVAGGETELDNPETNLELGQKYLEQLLNSQTVDGNLLYLVIAYNAGPGNLAKWKKRWSDVDDPLLFIELLPASETRAYVERVLANYWIYRLRENQETPTLDAITSGRKANFEIQSL